MSGRPDPKPEKTVKVKKQLRRTPLSKTRGNTKQREIVNPMSPFKSEVELFDTLWENLPHVSFLSDRNIDIVPHTSFWFNCFAHVLSKAKNRYPLFRLYEKNVVILHPEEHRLLDFGTEEQREEYAYNYHCDWNKIYALQKELKKEYKELPR